MPRFIDQDRIPLSCVDLEDGSMVATGTLASVGVMSYPWGLEAVGEDCLSDPEWIRTAHAPIVLEHPPGEGSERFLTPEKIAIYSDPAYDGPGKVIPGAVRVWWDDTGRANKIEVRVFDVAVAEGIRRGMYELSPGYLTPEIDSTPGELDGAKYKTRQRKRIGNHIALILAKEFGGRGGRGAGARFDARFDAGDPGITGGSDMTPEEIKAMIEKVCGDMLAAYKLEDEAKDKALLEAGSAGSGDLPGRMDALEKGIARFDAFVAAKDAEKGEPKPEPKDEPKPADDKKAEEEARMDAADESAVLSLAGSRGLDVSQPVAALRALLLESSGYGAKSRPLQRTFIGELAKHVRTDDAGMFGFKPLPVINGGQPRTLVDRSTRLADRSKK